MPGAPQIGGLEGAVEGLRRVTMKLQSDDERKRALKEVFKLNNEIGKLMHEFPSLADSLREMQLSVKLVTIAIKRGEGDRVAAALAGVSSALDDAVAAAAELESNRDVRLRTDL